MEHRREITIREVQEARLRVQQLHESEGAPEGEKLTDAMHEAVLALQERMANLDYQWQRALWLDVDGIFVYDGQGENWWRCWVWLSHEAKEWNDRQVRKYPEERRMILEERRDLPRSADPPPGVEAASGTSCQSTNYYRPASADDKRTLAPFRDFRPKVPDPGKIPPPPSGPPSPPAGPPPPPPPGVPPKRALQESLPLNGSRNGLAQVVPSTAPATSPAYTTRKL